MHLSILEETVDTTIFIPQSCILQINSSFWLSCTNLFNSVRQRWWITYSFVKLIQSFLNVAKLPKDGNFLFLKAEIAEKYCSFKIWSYLTRTGRSRVTNTQNLPLPSVRAILTDLPSHSPSCCIPDWSSLCCESRGSIAAVIPWASEEDEEVLVKPLRAFFCILRVSVERFFNSDLALLVSERKLCNKIRT